MAFIALQIVEPENGAAYVADASGLVPEVSFVGRLGVGGELPEQAETGPLYYRWYSSLYAGGEHHYAIEDNRQAAPDERFRWRPGLGSHAIALAVTDRPTEMLDDLKQAKHTGITGGTQNGEREQEQCIIHVFRANLSNPMPVDEIPANSILNLKAEAPFAWAIRDEQLGWVPNEDYHAYNRLRYRWRFQAQGQQPVDIRPNVRELEYLPPEDDEASAHIQYVWTVTLDPGVYQLTLFTEDTEEQVAGHSRTIEVTIV